MCRLFLITIACLAVLFGIVCLYSMPKIIQREIEQKMQLKIGTDNYDRFTRVPIPLTVKFYFFNVTNADQVLAGLERPHFEEVGPFMYEQWRRRKIVDFLDNNRKIIYREYKTFYSMWPKPNNNNNNNNNNSDTSPPLKMRHLSADNSTNNFMLNPYAHNVTIINLPLLSILTKLANLNEGMARSLAAAALSQMLRKGQDRILINRQVNELLFDGYKVDVLEQAKVLFSDHFNYNFESPLPRNKFGFFHGKNNTWVRDEAGEMTIFTGRNGSMDDYMLVDNWNGMRQLNTWPKYTEAGDRCNQIRGTDGSQFHPGISRDQALGIFSPMICTSIQVKYKEDTSCRGIPLLRFTTTPEMFAAPKKNPRNACYCTIKPASGGANLTDAPTDRNRSTTMTKANARAKITDSRCYIDGLMDLSLCQKGAPVAASAPHFYNGDPLLAHAAGLQPRKQIHETYMDIEPMTGSVMRAASRAQLNAFVEQAALEVIDSQLIGNMTSMVAPMLWLEEAAQIDEKSAAMFKERLLIKVQKIRRSSILAIAAGLLLALIVALQYWWVTWRNFDDKSAKQKREKLAESRLDKTSQRKRPHNYQGAKRSNLAQLSLRRPLVELDGGDDDDELDETVKLGVAAVAVAAAMGAADASVSRNTHRQKRSGATSNPKDTAPAADSPDDDALSGLVANEWPGAPTSTSGESQLTEPEASTSGQDPLLVRVEMLDEDGAQVVHGRTTPTYMRDD